MPRTLPPDTARDPELEPPALEPDSQLALGAAVLESTGEAVLSVDRDGRILTWNEAARSLFGMSARQVIGIRLVELSPAGPLQDRVADLLDRALDGGAWQGDLVVTDRGGRAVPILATVTPLRDPEQRIIGGVCVAREGTDRTAAAEALRRSEQRADMVRAASDSVIWEMDLRSGTLQWSDAITSTFGYPPDSVEPSETWWRERIHPDDRPRVEDRLRAILEEGARFWTEEYRFRRHDGGYALVFDRAHVAYDEHGVAVGAVGAMVDLTERRRLREEQRLLSQASMILDLSLDPETTLPTIARLTTTILADICFVRVDPGDGFPGLTTASHSDPRLQWVVDEIAGFVDGSGLESEVLQAVRRAGEPLLFARIPESAMDQLAIEGRARTLARDLGARSAVAVPLRAKRGLVGVLLVARTAGTDPYDEADVHVLEELGRRIGLAVDHARLFQEAQLANRAKSDFLAVISHELRTPLTAVLGYADLLSAEVSGPLNEKQKHQVDRIRAGSDRLLQLIEGILAFARLKAGTERVRRQAVKLQPLLERLSAVLGPRIREDGSTLVMETSMAPDVMPTDEEKLLQILVALLLNAMKFAHHGAIRLHVGRQDGRVTFDVSDNGSGIAPEHLPHIFNPFWQAEQPATRRAGGAGLGLSLARRTARLLHGDVVVLESSPAGTTFRLEIPEEVAQ